MRLFLFLAACSSPPAPPATSVEAGAECAKVAIWEACVGQRVAVEGAVPEVIYQHPVLGEPQSYLEVDGIQVVVVGLREGDCTRLSGVIERVDLGGEPGTRKSYRGWALRDARCAP